MAHSHAKSWTSQVKRSQAQSSVLSRLLPPHLVGYPHQAPDLVPASRQPSVMFILFQVRRLKAFFILAIILDLEIYEGFRSHCFQIASIFWTAKFCRLLGNVQRDLSWKPTLRITMSLSHPNSAEVMTVSPVTHMVPSPSCSSCPTIGGWISELENLSQ